jgi:nucleotide-binding universal stress UspA family protein
VAELTRNEVAQGFSSTARDYDDVVRHNIEGAPGSEVVLLEGVAAPTVCDWAGQEGVDLIVAGAHRGLLQRVALGSFAGYLTHHAPCAVLLVRPTGAEAAPE